MLVVPDLPHLQLPLTVNSPPTDHSYVKFSPSNNHTHPQLSLELVNVNVNEKITQKINLAISRIKNVHSKLFKCPLTHKKKENNYSVAQSNIIFISLFYFR